MMQQIQSICHVCKGEKEIISQQDRCKKCEGRKTNQQKKTLEVHVDKGMQDSQAIRFNGEGNQSPGCETGDVVVVLDEQKHDTFERRRQDLFTTVKLELVEALCGFTRIIHTLDSRDLVIKSKPGEVVTHNEMRTIADEGMPRYKNPFNKGRLVVRFEVNFPDDNFLSKDQMAALRKLLSPTSSRRGSNAAIPADAEECALHPFYETLKPSGKGTRGGLFRDDDDGEEEDNEGGMNGQRMQCGTQ
jgi:DnaJ-class molecular chaperone